MNCNHFKTTQSQQRNRNLWCEDAQNGNKWEMKKKINAAAGEEKEKISFVQMNEKKFH